MNIQIYPLDKIVFDNISICFGMEKSAVELALGAGEAIGDRYYYFNILGLTDGFCLLS